ncbi:MAG: Flagellar hook-basal body complex protein FliE [Acidimicrobiales bacterium]|jgi:flagellar hook-basal body complex protein FliE|nr:Flagellar hook-basal body complex protein FliE [Acidimicrobiales bacterium]
MVVPIGAVTAALPTLPTQATTSAAPTSGAGAGGFGDKVAQAMDDLQAVHTTADKTAQLAATGQLSDPSEYMIAATQASLATELTVAVRNKAVEAFNSIMSMGI